MLMKNVQLPGASSYDSEMAMHTSTSNIDISLSRGFQKHLSDPTLAHGLLDHGKDRFFFSKRNWNERDYHFRVIKDISYISVKMLCATTHFPVLLFCGLHAKPGVVRGLIRIVICD